MLAKFYVVFILLLGCCLPGLFAIDGVIVVTTDQSFQDKWNFTLGKVAPEFSKAETVFVGQKFSILLFLTDYKVGDNNEAHVTYDLDVLSPSFENIFEQSGIAALQGKVPGSTHVMLSESNLKASLDKHELPGRYWIQVRIYDWIDSVYKDLEASFELQPLIHEPFFTSDERFLDWHDQYYRNPRPELALDGFLYFTRSELRLDEAGYWPMFTFFLEIFKANPFLLPVLADMYAAQPPGSRIHLLYLFRFAGYRDTRFLDSLESEEQVLFKKLLSQELVPPTQPVSSPRELDVLWAGFLATGSYASIRTLVENLSYSQYKGAGRTYRSSEEPAKDLQATLYEGIYQNVLFTLVTSMESHPLVRSYCEYLLYQKDLPEDVLRELEAVLGENKGN